MALQCVVSTLLTVIRSNGETMLESQLPTFKLSKKVIAYLVGFSEDTKRNMLGLFYFKSKFN
ncbi:uncharacterized protein PHALS_15307 [Plasmopara halstedii]|uniref:Uncharacterized protein n=1 Tax=Plasmopara halstedii TaxID=4781 RepID=A0A0P1ADF4_PLAHL|nr:uncharacterized protein PHALS_15307 [Plasmopara halstedii]CEG38430.1 hypothetical protein PHALS_15307 [Plasmopara halstedii]|eukprot:XP_024574799.1 hypothetical protein PHALS_15307 [Plasmopara halstedii]